MIENVMAGIGLRYPPGAPKASPIENRALRAMNKSHLPG
jgi:hypothetical protein